MTLTEQLHRNESIGGYDLDDHKHLVPMAVVGRLGSISLEMAAQQEKEVPKLVAQDYVLSPYSDY